MQTLKRTALAAIYLIPLAAAACSSWAPPLPSSPSTLPSAMDSAPSGGATIQGRVQGVSTGTTAKLGSATPTLAALTTITTLTVKVVGTNISAPVSSSGAFVLEGVPAGNIQLQFSGQTQNAIATLGSVNMGDRLDVDIRLSGAVGIIEASIRVKTDSSTEIEGNVQAVSGSCPNLSFMVNGWTLKITGSTQTPCNDVKIGMKVKIKGTLASNRVVIVVRVEVSSRDDHHESHERRRDHDDDDDDDD